MERNAIKGESAAESTARHLKDLIREGGISPGDMLLSERDLAQRLDVSRPTLRQGMKILEDQGLLVAAPGGRAVAPLGREITDPLIALIASHAEVVDDFFEFRATTERMASRLAAARANAVDRARLTACMERIDRAHAAGQQHEEAEADVDLHIAVYEASHNLVLLHTMRALSGMLRQGVVENREALFAHPETRDQFRAQHRAIYESVMAGDVEAAGEAAETHIHYTHEALTAVRAADARLQVSLRRLSGGRISARRKGER
ncbi:MULTISPECIES: FCD domain-containing protein [Methylobacteriaceae]|uniref:FCD domain-containing protein n=1 Tax=Methylobacteriaceae TaxID=119045 RepID=UPI00074FA4C8|nr:MULTISPECIES: FCD domain-containing protein [Methylobacteriaceae]AMB46538.1 GntR family transcriptional regulator [Methylobacterium sp. AMS5]TFZ54552.1 FCD domain-containing protein [Methylorubrum sp. Q1]